jgi:hypothetical protein
MSFMASIEMPDQAPQQAEVEYNPADTWTTQDLIMAGQRMRALVPKSDEDWSWGYQRVAQGVVITVKLTGGTVVTSAPLDVPELVVPADDPPHWFGSPS